MSAQPRVRVLVLAGGRYSERAASMASAASVVAALDPDRYDVVRVEIDRTGAWLLGVPEDGPAERLALAPGEHGDALIPRAGGSLSQARAIGPIDVVLPMLHGPFGEDGTVQGTLDTIGLPYVGSGVLGSALAADKDVAKRVLGSAGIATARHVVFFAKIAHDFEPRLAKAGIGLPCFVKPARLGSGIGITKVRTHDELGPALELAFRHGRKVLVEEMIEGAEVAVGVLGNDEPVASVPGLLHVNREWYDQDARVLPGAMDLEAPASLDPAVAEELRTAALAAFRLCECVGMAEVGFFVTADGQTVVNEIDTIPAFGPANVYARLFEASGVPYPELLDRLIELALERQREGQAYGG
jgi:D-alanine-D-alanine ligase